MSVIDAAPNRVRKLPAANERAGDPTLDDGPATRTASDECEARRYGFEPDLHFITWHCAKPGG